MAENGYPCVRVDIYNTETNELVDSIYVETLWGYQGIMWGQDIDEESERYKLLLTVLSTRQVRPRQIRVRRRRL